MRTSLIFSFLASISLAACSSDGPIDTDTDVGRGSDSAATDTLTTVDTGPVEMETCGNGFDDDRNGLVDDGCACMLGETQPCYPGIPTDLDAGGACALGTQSCMGTGEFLGWGGCVNATVPTVEICSDGIDQDCNGMVDDGASCCSAPCYDGPSGTESVGACAPGVRSCEGGVAGSCVGQTVPREEICSDGIDQDCNGLVDDGAGCCEDGTSEACYDGPAGTEGTGVCVAGARICAAGTFGSCEGQHVPEATEICGNGMDDDCNGAADEGCSMCPFGDIPVCCVNVVNGVGPDAIAACTEILNSRELQCTGAGQNWVGASACTIGGSSSCPSCAGGTGCCEP